MPDTTLRLTQNIWKNRKYLLVLNENICVEIEIISVMRRERRGLEHSACASDLQSMVDILLQEEGCLNYDNYFLHVTLTLVKSPT